MAKRSLKAVSTADLQRELADRQRRLGSLKTERAKLAEELDAIDAEIRDLGGTAAQRSSPKRAAKKTKKSTRRKKASSRAPKRSASKKRVKNSMTLVDALAKTLRKPMSVSDAAAAVKKAGYKTKSKNFRAVVNLALIKNPKRFKRVERGTYRVAA